MIGALKDSHIFPHHIKGRVEARRRNYFGDLFDDRGCKVNSCSSIDVVT
jgi:hypothetical protein